MNWLSQMINSPIDLIRMYPAEPDPERKPAGRRENLDGANDARSNKARARIFAALGADALTTKEVQYRIEQNTGFRFTGNTVGRLLRRMADDGDIVCTDPNGSGKKLLWSIE